MKKIICVLFLVVFLIGCLCGMEVDAVTEDDGNGQKEASRACSTRRIGLFRYCSGGRMSLKEAVILGQVDVIIDRLKGLSVRARVDILRRVCRRTDRETSEFADLVKRFVPKKEEQYNFYCAARVFIHGEELLHLAARIGQAEVVEALLEGVPTKERIEASFLRPDMCGETALFIAIREAHLDVVKVLFEGLSEEEWAAVLERVDSDGSTVLHEAICSTVLHKSIYWRRVEVVEFLLGGVSYRAQRAAVKKFDSSGRTVLDDALDMKELREKKAARPDSDERLAEVNKIVRILEEFPQPSKLARIRDRLKRYFSCCACC
jgi:hypothetical protein